MVEVRAEATGDAWLCTVSVDHAGQRTRHTVTVRPADIERWANGGKRADVEGLVARSFDFLLEREPPSAILARFDLSVIQSYFPEYDRAFRPE
ncbi:MAG TPA: hypothetical protein VG426_14690 [Candidatus Dormibacteraeota bacterium]|jgi:hypothetical protein|nr:hypothetical protein [Candidatus Dormibacteraeota bacterium]